MSYTFPGWPGSAFSGRRAMIAGVAPPAMPRVPSVAGPGQGPGAGGPALSPAGAGLPAQAPHAAPHPLAGMAAFGVPIRFSPSGQPMIQAGAAGIMPTLPPELPGMPKMPAPHPGLLGGGPFAGGLFQPMAPVVPVDPGNQVRH